MNPPEDYRTSESSYQLYEQTNKGKKARTQTFNEIRQFVYVLGTEGEKDYINQRLHDIIHWDNTPLYIGRESLKKKKPTNLKSDQIEIRIIIRNYSTSTCNRPAVDRSLCRVKLRSVWSTIVVQSQVGLLDGLSGGQTLQPFPKLLFWAVDRPVNRYACFIMCTFCAWPVDRPTVFGYV